MSKEQRVLEHLLFLLFLLFIQFCCCYLFWVLLFSLSLSCFFLFSLYLFLTTKSRKRKPRKRRKKSVVQKEDSAKERTKEQIKVSLECSHTLTLARTHKWNNQISRLTEAVWGSLPLISLRWSVWFVDKISFNSFSDSEKKITSPPPLLPTFTRK